MDPSPSPPDLPSPDQDMALVAANGLPPMPTNKRYRPSPAKTFQCRGYGECRMVFSRSEHLARHIRYQHDGILFYIPTANIVSRKHTGERPFSCHCSKQFSRLDNLRQHAQTVHADKQDENERMMRDLTSLHASMSAANKLGGVRTGRKIPNPTNGNSASGPLILIKQEDVAHQRPDTSTGYESGEAMYSPNGSSFRDQNHSFREPGQSFLAPPSTGAAPAAHNQSFLAYPRAHFQSSDPADRPGASSRPSTASGLADPHPRSLPPLAAVVSASLSSPQTPPSPGPHSSASQQHHLQQQQQQSLLPFPSSLAHYRRSSITHRPGTAPASASLFARSSFPDRSRLGSSSGRPDLSLLHSGFAGRPFGFVDHLHQQFTMGDSSDLSPSPGNDPSPFFFNPPVPPPTAAATTTTGSSPVPVNNNPRKRPFGGPDGPSDDSNQLRADRPTSSAGPFGELNYEYGTESRPQSRRLTVMELCNDEPQPRPPSQRREQQQQHSSASSPFLLSTAPAPSHPPTTSSGLVSSTSTLRLFDRAASPGSTQQPTTVFSRTSYAAAGTVGDGASGGRGSKEGGRRGSATSYGPLSSDSPEPTFSNRTTSPSYSPPAVLSTSNSASDAYVVSQRQQQQQYYPKQPHHSPQYFPNSPTFSTASNDSSCSPRSPLSDSSAGDSPFPSYAHTSTRTTATTSSSVSASTAATALYATGQHTNAHTSSGISAQSHHLHHHHRQRNAQVRASVSPHPGFGMRV